jgi:hypothetical protein
MTAGLPPNVTDCFERFITTELTTIDARQQPITWPVTPYYAKGAASIDVTTGLGYPKKADDARRNRHVALLFSEPTGSGIESRIQVLVQGTAEVDESDLTANRERYAAELPVKLPSTKDMHPPKFMQRLFQWYYTRIYIKVRPERVFVWADGELAQPPEILGAHLEEVRSGHSEEPPEPHVPAAGGATAWDERMDELGTRYPTAVLSWVGPDGFPIAVRVPVKPDHGTQRIELGLAPAGLPMTDGLACLTAHAHAPDFTWQKNFQVRGDLIAGERGWSLVPHRLVGGLEMPESAAARSRLFISKHWRFYRTARARRQR